MGKKRPIKTGRLERLGEKAGSNNLATLFNVCQRELLGLGSERYFLNMMNRKPIKRDQLVIFFKTMPGGGKMETTERKFSFSWPKTEKIDPLSSKFRDC
jgi:hypothetical protein